MTTACALSALVAEGLAKRNMLCHTFFAREADRLAEACRGMSDRFLQGGRLLAVRHDPAGRRVVVRGSPVLRGGAAVHVDPALRVAHEHRGGGVQQVLPAYDGPLGRPEDRTGSVDERDDLGHVQHSRNPTRVRSLS